MSENADCPSPDQLHRALSGDLPPDRVDAIEQHLLECGSCAEQTLHTGDLQTYSQALRESAQHAAEAVPGADAEQLEQLIDRLRSLPHQQEVTQLSGITQGSGATDLESNLIRYLQPARTEEELGWLGTYRVLKLLGSGGMGGVFLAEDTQLHRRVALKVMRPDVSGQANADERFLREARAAAAVHHDHIVTIFQVGRDGQIPFLAMEFLEGESLEDRLRRERVMPLADILRIGREIAEGLAAAHARGLVHRDIKPANIWLESRGGHLPKSSQEAVPPRVKLLDFGLARSADVNFELTSQGMVIGTPAYMAPEQAAGDLVDHRADLFSLGIVLYRLATGVLPFQGKDAISTLVAIRSETPDDPRQLRSDLPPALSELIIQLLHKNPSERLASAGEVATRLAEIPLSASSTPSPRDTPTLAYERQPPVKSRGFKRIVAAGALFALFVLGAIVVVTTDKGRVEINSKVDDVDFKIVLTPAHGEGITAYDTQTGSQVQWFWSGKYDVTLKGDTNSIALDKTSLTLKRGVTEILTLTRKPNADSSPTAVTKPPTVNANLKLAPPAAIAEPPPLSEWLKGRKVLTVAQDGSAQFTTIQDALNALKPGGIVKVLDRGPYRERLDLEAPPEDSGLVSEQRTMIELPNWKRSESAGIEGHVLCFAKGFRIHGFAFEIANDVEVPPFVHALVLKQSTGVVLENCSVRWPDRPDSFVGVNWFAEGPSQSCWIRECLFANGVILNSSNSLASVVIEKCFFMGSESGLDVSVSDGQYDRIAIRENVFGRDKQGQDILLNFSQQQGHINHLQITNNTTLSPTPVTVSGNVPTGRVQINNHLRLHPGLLRFVKNAEAELPRAVREWDVGHNVYPRTLRAGETGLTAQNLFPQMETDVLTAVAFQSTDIHDRDYLRIADHSRLSGFGEREDLPTYAGAFPPGRPPPAGDWFTRIRERWLESEFKQSESATPVAIAEPPPLAEWLKGRKVLTVAQDGSGQFKTIQAALNALQPGETVKVLDKGPYRERLESWALPQDSGLISEVQTVLEVPTWKEHFKDKDPVTGGEVQVYAAHILTGANAFRLHGFEMQFPPSDGQSVRRLSTSQTKSFVLENCVFHASGSFEGDPVDIGDWDPGGGVGMTVWMRECIIEGSAAFTANYIGPDDAKRQSTIVVERNYFAGVGTEHHLMIVGAAMRNVVIRHNVFAGNSTRDILLTRPDAPIHFEVSNNSLLSPNSITFGRSVPQAGVTIRNNLHARSGFVTFFGGNGTVLREAAQRWIVDHNAYPDLLAGEPHPLVLPRQPGDLSILPRFLSKVPEEADYLRIRADDPLAKAGAGGAWPQYIGALAPGPAPKAGDWFTRLREPSGNIQPSAVSVAGPVQVDEPPPLAEWLKGREVITVAQDGSGQHQTITSALQALKAGQVIKVLDAGTYQEHLQFQELPSDVGLISDQQATLETDNWSIGHAAHDIGKLDGFRLSGFRFIAPRTKDWRTTTNWMDPSGLVIEDCYFGRSGEGLPTVNNELAVQLTSSAAMMKTKPVVIRNCVFDGGVVAVSQEEYFPNTIVISMNLFRRGRIYVSSKEVGRIVLRNNVFEMADRSTFHLDKIETVHESLEISNNTIAKPPSARDSQLGLLVAGAVPDDKVTICNNFMSLGIVIADTAKGTRLVPGDSWQVDHNTYISLWPREWKDPSNFRHIPDYLSWDNKHRDAWRISTDGPLATSGAGGPWPSYIGALPPGPAPAAGDWFTHLQKRWPTTADPIPDKATSPQPTSIPEAPALAEWLKDRTILTVAQDGSGQFKTIADAFRVLKAGQVVRILDRGPYHEALEYSVPPDTGLISDVGTVIEARDWAGKPSAHHLSGLEGFRLNGLRFQVTPRDGWFDLMFVTRPSGLVVENCSFGLTGPVTKEPTFLSLQLFFDPAAREQQPVWIRECLFEFGGFGIPAGKVANGTIIIERNLFRQAGVAATHTELQTLIVRHNLFDVPKMNPFWFDDLTNVRELLEITNNTATISETDKNTGVSFITAAPEKHVVIRNNLSDSHAGLGGGAVDVRSTAIKNWVMDHNGYVRQWGAFVKSASDIVARYEFLGGTGDDINAWRLAPDSPFAKTGAGGALPDYMGALPPGPAPAAGDWFTRLRERWLTTNLHALKPAASSPLELPEPPPLTEWLKGRQVLTVAQDGSGQFKTIQAALDALQPGQVVKVIDKGPYRERLDTNSLSHNSGLISEVQTILEAPEWKESFKTKDPSGKEITVYVAHALHGLNQFRLHGFEMKFPPSDGKWTQRFSMDRTRNVVLENCFLDASETFEGEDVNVGNWSSDAGVGIQVWIRDCLLEGSVALNGQNKGVTDSANPSTLVIERNYFKGVGTEHHLMIQGDAWQSLVVRQNVFAGKSGRDIVLTGINQSADLEVSNNSLLSRLGLTFVGAVPRDRVHIHNNLHDRKGIVCFMGGDGTVHSTAAQRWNMDHNAYPDAPTEVRTDRFTLPRRPLDIAILPRFLSKVPQEADYLRIAQDDPLATAGAGGKWPMYIGALPPGPPSETGDWFSRLRDKWSKVDTRK